VDVGQGDSTVIQSLFNQEVYVIDTGGRLSFEQEEWQQRTYRAGAEYTLLPFLKGEGVRQIDGLFLTHGDADHLGDAAKVIEKIPVKWVYIGKGSLQHPSIQRLAKQLPKRTKIREVEMNEVIGKRLPLQVLAPKYGKGENEDSLVLTTTIRDMRFLMTGDLGKDGERKLLKDYPNLTVDVMKLGHHGSKTSTDNQFIKKIQLKQGIISSGKNNRFNHPHPEVLETLAENQVRVFRTDQSGMIRYLWGIKEQKPTVWLAKEY
jgi:competence protein ComEC